jgi:hypothetical protein
MTHLLRCLIFKIVGIRLVRGEQPEVHLSKRAVALFGGEERFTAALAERLGGTVVDP